MDHIAGSYHGYMPQNMYGMIPKFIHFARLVKGSNRLKKLMVLFLEDSTNSILFFTIIFIT